VVYGAYISNVEAVSLARNEAEIYQQARIAMDRMAVDLESSIVEMHVKDENIEFGMIGENREINGHPADTVNFTAFSHLSLVGKTPKTDLCEIGFELTEEHAEQILFLQRREDYIPDENIKEGGTSHELAWNVGGLNIVYEDGQGDRFDEWNTFEGQHKGSLPSLITIRLTLNDPEGRERTFELSVHPGLAGKSKHE
jgi:hypothetical protein